MKIIAAPDSYKGSISAPDAARCMAEGVKRIFKDATVVEAPISDGGEGTVESLVKATGGELKTTRVHGPLGVSVDAFWGVLGDKRTAVIEMASASGLTLLKENERNPLKASTYGVGELVKVALDEGLDKFIIGIGGSATNDGGSGFAKALGVNFLDKSGNELELGGAALTKLSKIDLSGLDERLKNAEILVACDVDNPLCGERGASAVFGPQKGATPAMVQELDSALRHYADVASKALGKDIQNLAGAGAAGGLGAGLLFFSNAKLRPGIEIVLEAMNFENIVNGADLVLTGEGNTDFQTAFGKAPVGVASIAKKHGCQVVCISGGLSDTHHAIYDHGIDAAIGCPDGPMSLDECIKHGKELVTNATERVCRLLKVGMNLKS